MTFLEASAIVACHPDDELLWFGAILPDVDRVIVAYEDAWFLPGLGERRREALARYPRSIESLAMGEAASAGCANWAQPRISKYGLSFGRHVARRDAKQIALRTVGQGRAPYPTRAAHYRANFHELRDRLRSSLVGVSNVFTHNPWGEYGHEDHVQMFRVLSGLQQEMGFELWMSNYVTERSMPLACTYFGNGPGEMITLPVDARFCDRVAQVYRDADCWTWAEDWWWFATEVYCRAPTAQRETSAQAHIMPLNAFNIEPVRLAQRDAQADAIDPARSRSGSERRLVATP